MKITTRLEIATSDENNFKAKVANYVGTLKLDQDTVVASTLQELVTYHRQQIHAAFRLGFNEGIRKESKEG